MLSVIFPWTGCHWMCCYGITSQGSCYDLHEASFSLELFVFQWVSKRHVRTRRNRWQIRLLSWVEEWVPFDPSIFRLVPSACKTSFITFGIVWSFRNLKERSELWLHTYVWRRRRGKEKKDSYKRWYFLYYVVFINFLVSHPTLSVMEGSVSCCVNSVIKAIFVIALWVSLWFLDSF